MAKDITTSRKAIKIHSTGEMVEADIVSFGLTVHRDSDGVFNSHAGQHENAYARDDEGNYYRLNRAYRWTKAYKHTLDHAREAFRQAEKGG